MNTTLLLVATSGLFVGMILVLIPMIFTLRGLKIEVKKVEHATNGLTRALVKATGDKEFLRGIAQGTEDEKAREKGEGD